DALERALAGPAAHVLLIASRRKAQRLRELMRGRGITEAQLIRLQAPAGPDAGAKTPTEIALVGVVGVLAAWRARRGNVDAMVMPSRTDTSASAKPRSTRASAAVSIAIDPPAATFLNPVCGIAAPIANAKHVGHYDD